MESIHETVIIAVLVLGAIAYLLRRYVFRRRRGGSSCGGSACACSKPRETAGLQNSR